MYGDHLNCYNSMLIGYARVSTHEQILDLQLDALEKIGCSKIFTDKISTAKAERPGLTDALAYVRERDTLVVWRLDRLGRSLKELIEIVKDLNNRHVEFQSITENIDTTTPGGKLIFHIFGALAEFERDIIRERTKAGLEAARARGRIGGKPKAHTLNTPKKVAIAQSLYDDKSNSIDEICKTLNISRATLYRYIDVKKNAA
jgi:DNA invertase Pin-like site-specific DNA recombinase